MHKDDQMTPLERKKALANGEPVDRMPIAMLFGAPAHRLLGFSRRQETESPENMAAVQIKVYEEFGLDSVSCKYGILGMGASFGAEMSDPEFDVPSILTPPLKRLEDVDNLDLGHLTVARDPIAGRAMAALKIIREKIGDEVGIGMMLPGPFTAAASLCGPEKVLKAIHREPDKLHHLIEFALQGLMQMAEEFLKEDFTISVADPVASGTILKPSQYGVFAQPYSTRFVDHCKKIRPQYGVSCHICGDTTPICEQMVDCGYSALSLDNLVDLKQAKEQVGHRVHLAGNVSPVDELQFGTPESVKAAVRKCFRDCWDNPKGFTISTGCDTPLTAPLENAYAYVAEARRCAKYPIDPKNFAEE
jgi:uroporphyrinogen decarboxylase